MLGILIAIAPVFILILLGYGLKRGGIPSVDFWNLNDRLVYWVLMPALFFVKISVADLGSEPIARFASILYIGFLTAVVFGHLASRLIGRGPAVGSSILQGSARFNTFMALAIAEALYGAQGLQVAILASALLVPVVNIVIVVSMATMLRGTGEDTPGVFRGVLRDLGRNPLILSIGAGLAFNLSGIGAVPVLHETLIILGAAALPIMLLCVGANLRVGEMRAALRPMMAATGVKMIIFPLVVALAALLLQPGPLVAQVALIFAALPTGVAAYTLARQMGGDAPLMAGIITAQTALSLLVMPVVVLIGEWIF